MRLNDKILNMNLPLDLFFIAEPIVKADNKVIATEILTRFSLSETQRNVAFSAEFIFKRASRGEKRKIFYFQLEEIKKQSFFFKSNNIKCTVNADRDIAEIVCNSSDIRSVLEGMPYITLEISENFCAASDNDSKRLIKELSKNFELWLDDFGAGHANLSALQSGFYETVKIDKDFFWKQFKSPLWPVIVREIRRYSSSIIVEGVESDEHFLRLKDDMDGMQGYLFPATLLSNIDAVLKKQPVCLHKK